MPSILLSLTRALAAFGPLAANAFSQVGHENVTTCYAMSPGPVVSSCMTVIDAFNTWPDGGFSLGPYACTTPITVDLCTGSVCNPSGVWNYYIATEVAGYMIEKIYVECIAKNQWGTFDNGIFNATLESTENPIPKHETGQQGLVARDPENAGTLLGERVNMRAAQQTLEAKEREVLGARDVAENVTFTLRHLDDNGNRTCANSTRDDFHAKDCFDAYNSLFSQIQWRNPYDFPASTCLSSNSTGETCRSQICSSYENTTRYDMTELVYKFVHMMRDCSKKNQTGLWTDGYTYLRLD